MIRKLTINTDHYLIEIARIEYIILRIEGNTIDYTLARRLRNYPNPYRLHTEIFEDLAKVYKDLDRITNSDREYIALQIDTIGKFIEFYSKYVRLGAIYKHSNDVLIRQIFLKLPIRLKNRLEGHDKFSSIKAIKEFLIEVDNTQRVEYQQKLILSAIQVKTKLGKDSLLPSRAIKIITPSNIYTKPIPTTTLTRKAKTKYSYYKYGNVDYIARDYKEEHQNEARKKA